MRKKIFVLFAMAALAASLVAIPAAHAQDMTPPTVPTGISAYITQSGQVYVPWNPSTDDIGVVGYYLYRDGQLVANTPGLLFFTDNAPAGTHAYTVAAYDAAGNISGQSPASSLVTVVADTTPPTAPTGLTLVPSSSSIALSWIASTDNVAVIGYYVYRNGQKMNLPNQITGTNYTDTGLSPGIAYSYQVGAYDAAGNIARSNQISATTIFDVTPPSPPYGLHALATSTSEIDLSWSPATDNVAVAGYQIYRNSAYLGSGNGTSTTYQDTGLSPSTQYSYWVVAVDEVGNVRGTAFRLPQRRSNPTSRRPRSRPAWRLFPRQHPRSIFRGGRRRIMSGLLGIISIATATKSARRRPRRMSTPLLRQARPIFTR